jgi:hypothetical protein
MNGCRKSFEEIPVLTLLSLVAGRLNLFLIDDITIFILNGLIKRLVQPAIYFYIQEILHSYHMQSKGNGSSDIWGG